MKRTRLAVLSAAALAFGAGTLNAQDSPLATDAPDAPPPPHAPQFAQILTDLVTKYDVNKDGQLDATELATMRADAESGKLAPPPPRRMPHMGGRLGGGPPPELLQQYDTDKDGHLNESERAALQADIESGKVVPPRQGDAQHARPSAQQLLDRFDADKNGTLDATELEAMLNEGPGPRRAPMHARLPAREAPPGQ